MPPTPREMQRKHPPDVIPLRDIGFEIVGRVDLVKRSPHTRQCHRRGKILALAQDHYGLILIADELNRQRIATQRSERCTRAPIEPDYRPLTLEVAYIECGEDQSLSGFVLGEGTTAK